MSQTPARGRTMARGPKQPTTPGRPRSPSSVRSASVASAPPALSNGNGAGTGKPRGRGGRGFDQNRDVFEKFLYGVKGIANKPVLLALIVVALLIFYDTTHIVRLHTWLKLRPSTAALGHWIAENAARVGGMAILTPGLYMVPEKKRIMSVAAVFVMLFVLPPLEPYIYLAVGTGMVLYFQVPDLTFRTSLLGIAFFWVWLYVLADPAAPAATASPPTSRK